MSKNEKKDYIKSCFRNYISNKKRLETLLIPGLGGVDYTRPSCVTGDCSNGVENGVVKYIDEKTELGKKLEIVRRTIQHYKIEDKRTCIEGKEKFIYNRFLRRFPYRRAAVECCISERTAMYWEEEIYFTAECIAEEYQLF